MNANNPAVRNRSRAIPTAAPSAKLPGSRRLVTGRRERIRSVRQNHVAESTAARKLPRRPQNIRSFRRIRASTRKAISNLPTPTCPNAEFDALLDVITAPPTRSTPPEAANEPGHNGQFAGTFNPNSLPGNGHTHSGSGPGRCERLMPFAGGSCSSAEAKSVLSKASASQLFPAAQSPEGALSGL